MNEMSLHAPAKPRADILVSVCFSDLPASDAGFAAVRDLAARLDACFRFREIILVVDEDGHEAYLPLIAQVSDLRLFTVRSGNGYYRRRVIAAEEAIGDIVMIGNFDEIRYIDVVAMLMHAVAQDAIVLATRSIRHPVRSGLSSPMIALGRVAGFKVNLNDLQTIVLPRTQLNQILSHSDPELALRFPPRDPRLPLSFFTVEMNVPFRGGADQFRRRVQLLQKLLVYLAPIVLLFVSVSSAILTLLGLAYAFYVVGAFILIDDLAPGWLTTSAMLSTSATFMGVSTLGLSLGLQQVLNQNRKSGREEAAHEINRIDLFGKAAADLNVDLERDPAPVVADKP